MVWYSHLFQKLAASLVAQRLKHLPAMRETWARSLGQEDPLEKKMATHSSILAWEIPWTEKPGGLQSVGSQRVRHNLVIKPPLQKKETSSPNFQLHLPHFPANLHPQPQNLWGVC